jgi:small conductance mechanosensitive channel
MRQEAEAHPSCIDRRTPEELEDGVPRVIVRVIKLEESHVLLRAYVWASEPITARLMQFDLLRSFKLRFDREGIIIPYPQRTISFKGVVPQGVLINGGREPSPMPHHQA